MNLLLIFPRYLIWHYSGAFGDIFGLFGNFTWFLYNYFSIGLLFGTLFSPWKRLARDVYGPKPSFFSNLAVNLLMRISGFFVRLATIAIGIFSIVALFFILLAVLMAWFFLPAIFALLIILAIGQLIPV
jgi:hypothetical protein